MEEGVWPMRYREDAPQARRWWLDLLASVTSAVNQVDWQGETNPQGRYLEIARTATEKQVTAARKERRVMALCDLSDLDTVLDDPDEGGVYSRLTGPMLDARAPGISEEDRADHRREMLSRLRLGALAEVYLASAAEATAARYAEALAEAAREVDTEQKEV